MTTMNKHTLLRSIEEGLQKNIISADEVRGLLATEAVVASPVSTAIPSKTFSISGVLYYVGAGIAFIGVAIFVGQHWDELSSALRILLTLGAGLALFTSAVFLEVGKKLDRIPDALHFLAGLLIPGGIFVTLNELGFHGGNFGPGIIFCALALFYVVAYRMHHHNLLLAFAIIYGTISFGLLTDSVATQVTMNAGDYISYRIIAVATSYLFLGYAFRESSRKVLSGILYFFGGLGVLGAGMALQGWSPDQSAFWEVVYPGLVFGALFLSTHLRSKSLLFLGAAFCAGDIFKLTDEYFRDNFSWPLALIFAGFVLIGVGYLTVYLNKKYLKKNVS